MNIKSSLVSSAKDAKNYVLKKYKNGFQPLVNTDDIFISIINEKIIIESIEKLYDNLPSTFSKLLSNLYSYLITFK